MENGSQLKSELKSLDEIFRQGKRVFSIPDYQRGYSWEKKQRTDLLTDIEYLIESGYDYRHFTGTIVATLITTNTEKGYEVFNIVDGQQRVTSLILLLSVICRIKRESTENSNCEYKHVFSKFIREGPEGNSVCKLNLGEDQDNFFQSLVEEGITTSTDTDINSKSDQNLKDAVNEFQRWLKKQENIDNVLKCVCKKLGFLFYAPENSKEIDIMFEVINNRGKNLSELEKIKNYLIYYARKYNKTEIRKLVNDSWPKILSNLNKINYTSNEDEDRFLRNCWIVFMDPTKSRSRNVYDNLKQVWPPHDEPTPENTKKYLSSLNF